MRNRKQTVQMHKRSAKLVQTAKRPVHGARLENMTTWAWFKVTLTVLTDEPENMYCRR